MQVTLDQATAAIGVIGAGGGALNATGSDGTVFTLTVPAGALAMDEQISMTPVSSISGLPAGASPEHTLGVSLEPDGLELGNARPPWSSRRRSRYPRRRVGLSFHGQGTNTGFHHIETSGTGATVALDHFSGYEVAYPLEVAAIQPTVLRKFYTQDQIEERFQSEVAAVLMLVRQKQLLGVPADFDLRDFARTILTVYKRLVISPRVAAADRSCTDAQAAMRAYLVYQRQRQLLGVADDPEFDLVGAGSLVPSDLVDIAVARCFDEQFQRCAAYGEFRALAAYFLTFFQQLTFLGIPEPKAEHLRLAVGYLSRCGRWRVRLATTLLDISSLSHDSYHLEATREFYVQWQPSAGGAFDGILGSTITGVRPRRDHAARPHDPVVPGDDGDGARHRGRDRRDHLRRGSTIRPGRRRAATCSHRCRRKLTLEANLGAIGYVLSCAVEGDKNADERFPWSDIAALMHRGVDVTTAFTQVAGGAQTVTFDNDWRFDTQPYRATTVQEETLYPAEPDHSYSVYARNELVIEHSPT